MAGWCYGDINEYRLLRHLMTDYDASARPVSNSTFPLQVVFGMSLHLIIDVVCHSLSFFGKMMSLPNELDFFLKDERNQILTTNCWLTQKWNDSHLTWNSEDYGGVSVVRIPYERVWRPDIILYNKLVLHHSEDVRMNPKTSIYWSCIHPYIVKWKEGRTFATSEKHRLRLILKCSLFHKKVFDLLFSNDVSWMSTTKGFQKWSHAETMEAYRKVSLEISDNPNRFPRPPSP